VVDSAKLDVNHGSCGGQDINLFFSRDGETITASAARMRAVARTYCQDCVIREACRTVGKHIGLGLWGGMLFQRREPGRPMRAIDLLDNAQGR
jgi:hypothetical protein